MKWILTLVIAIFAIIAGNMYVLKLPYDTKMKILRIQGVTIFEGIIFCGSYIIWQTVKSALHRTRSTIRKICLSLLAVYLFISNTCFFSILFLIDTNPHWYSMLGFICFGIFAQLIFAVLSLKGLFLMLRVIAKIGLIKLHKRKGSDQCGPDFIPSRLGRVSLLLIFIYSVAMGLYGVQQAWKPPNVVRVNLTLPRFPSTMNGLRVLQIADIHLGETVGRKTVQNIVNIAQDLQPGNSNRTLRVYSHLPFIRCELLRELFNPCNRKKWPHKPLLNFSVQSKFCQTTSVNCTRLAQFKPTI